MSPSMRGGADHRDAAACVACSCSERAAQGPRGGQPCLCRTCPRVFELTGRRACTGCAGRG